MTADNPAAFKPNNPWPLIGWWAAASLLVVAFVLGFVVLGREQQNGAPLGMWTAICRAIGIGGDTRAASEAQPPLRVPSDLAWTPATLAQLSKANAEHGAFVALNCASCHGEQGAGRSDLFPTLAGMDAASIYKQLDDFRRGKRPSGVMHGIAQALTPEDTADVAAYFASRSNGLKPIADGGFRSGRTLRQADPAVRLAFAGDPARGIPPCAACHGPEAGRLGAPSLAGQEPAYIVRELAAFAQGMRANDINEQMRTIATQLSPSEMHAVAAFYGRGATMQAASR
ncbi:MAG TPA: c-type cytochrome [Acetobacteraceae bacterium]|nr:c-type cytochrome [Acetobacteraceae bacterium]